jgi:hypothetical protein
MAQRRRRAGQQPRQVDAEVRQSEQVAERSLLPPFHPRCERLGIVRPLGPKRRIGGDHDERMRNHGGS